MNLLSLFAFAFEEIGRLVKSPLTSEAADLSRTIAAIYDAVDGAVAGKVSPEQASDQIAVLLADLRANDAAADAALAAKFKEPTT